MTAEQAGLVPLATIRIATPFRRELLVASDGENIVASDFVAVKRGAKTRPDPLLAEAQAQVQAPISAGASCDSTCPCCWKGPRSARRSGARSRAFRTASSSRTPTLRAPWDGRSRIAASPRRWAARRSICSFRRIAWSAPTDGSRAARPGSTRLLLVAFERAKERATSARKN